MNFWRYSLISQKMFSRTTFILLCVVIIGGRWVTQIWLGPVPLLDFILQSLIVASIFNLFFIGNHLHKFSGAFKLVPFLSILIFLITACRIVYSIVSGLYPIEFIFRDSSVFLAISSIFFIANYFYGANLVSQELKLSRLIFFASALSLILAVISKVGSNFEGWSFDLPLLRFEANILSVRSDQLLTSLSCFFITCSYKISIDKTKKNLWRFLYLFSGLFVIIELSSRAVFISFLTIILLGFFIKKRLKYNNEPKIIFVMISTFALIVLTLTFSERIAGFRRLIAGFSTNSIDSNSDILELSASGTQNARIQAWKLVWSYWQNHGLYQGIDFGDHFILNSGAFRYLSGATDVRWPHSFLLSIFVRNGIFCGTLFVLLITLVFLIMIANLRHENSHLLDWHLFAISLTILLVSSVGVVIESPFGYIPFVVASSISLVRFINRKNFDAQF